MLENLRKKGQPVTKELQDMADWLDGLEASANEAEVRACKLASSNMTASSVAFSGGVWCWCAHERCGKAASGIHDCCHQLALSMAKS